MNLKIDGVNLYYEIHGKGDPLLMIQGWGADLSNWQNIIESLSKNFQLILFDNRGMGRSEVTPGDYTTRLYHVENANKFSQTVMEFLQNREPTSG